MVPILVKTLNWRQWPKVATDWDRIHDSYPGASYFLSREWVSCWLSTFGEDLNPDLITFANDTDTVGCCLLVWRTQWVRGIPMRRVYLNCAGENAVDSTCIEYNSLLSLPDFAEPVAEAFQAFLRRRGWDEILLQGLEEHSLIRAAVDGLGANEVSVRPSYYVDLRRIRDENTKLDSVFSSNTRQQIRRSRRLYEKTIGPCTLRVAQTVEDATDILTRLVHLHQKSWRRRGQSGVFSSIKFAGFHQRLIRTGFERGHILLLEVCAGSEVIGVLYNFLYRGRVYFYQSGFCYSTDHRLKPGLLTHYLAISYCLQQPALTEYDFLAGDSQYKRSLSTESRLLHWIIVRRSTPLTVMFRALRAVKRRLHFPQKPRGAV